MLVNRIYKNYEWFLIQHSKGNLTQATEYIENNIDLSIDEIAEQLKDNYDGRFIIIFVHEFFKYKVFNKEINKQMFQRKLYQFDDYVSKHNSVDEIYERAIKEIINFDKYYD